MLLGRLAGEGGHPLRACARDRLVCRDAHAGEAGSLLQGAEDAGERDRAAVRVRDDPVAVERLERAVAVHLGHDERVAVDQAVRRGLVDAEGAARGRGRDELAARRGSYGEQEEVDVACSEGLRRRLLDDELALPERDPAAGGALGRERANILVAALGEQGERDGADCTGRADDTDSRPLAHSVLF